MKEACLDVMTWPEAVFGSMIFFCAAVCIMFVVWANVKYRR